MESVEFWFEFASSYSYPAALRVEEATQRAGARLVWRPFLLGPIFKAQGWNDSPFNIHPAKGNYMWRDLQRVCDGLGMPFRKPSVFPRNGLLAGRLACLFSEEPWLPEFVRQIFRANFAHDCDISRPDVVKSVLETIGQPASLIDAGRSPEAKAKFHTATERAVSLGIFGAPSFVVGSELFWGNDRLESAISWAFRGESDSRGFERQE